MPRNIGTRIPIRTHPLPHPQDVGPDGPPIFGPHALRGAGVVVLFSSGGLPLSALLCRCRCRRRDGPSPRVLVLVRRRRVFSTAARATQPPPPQDERPVPSPGPSNAKADDDDANARGQQPRTCSQGPALPPPSPAPSERQQAAANSHKPSPLKTSPAQTSPDLIQYQLHYHTFQDIPAPYVDGQTDSEDGDSGLAAWVKVVQILFGVFAMVALGWILARLLLLGSGL